MLIKSPCKDCPKRTLTCHHKDNCKEWSEYRAAIDAQNAIEQAESDLVGARIDSLNRRKKRKNAKGYF